MKGGCIPLRTFKSQSKMFFSVLAILLTFMLLKPVQAAIYFTEEERAFILETPVIEAVSLDGSAPLQYYDDDGELQGISKEILSKVSKVTGLTFTYYLVDSLEKALTADADIIFGIPNNYAPDDLVLSLPFLETESIVYINRSVEPS